MVVIIVSVVLVISSVTIHYAFLKGLLILLPRISHFHHGRVSLTVLGALTGHLVEIALFGTAFFLLTGSKRFGTIAGTAENTLNWGDCFYYSSVTYTSLGFGDLTPTGMLRLLSAVEVLTGVVLVAWTASFLFLVMQKAWADITNDRTGETG